MGTTEFSTLQALNQLFLDAKIGKQFSVAVVILALRARATDLRLNPPFLNASKHFYKDLKGSL